MNRSIVNVGLATVGLLLIPLVAVQFTDEVAWGAGDFVIAGALLFGAGVTYRQVASKRANTAYRVAAGIAVAAALVLVWMNLAVGLIGSEDNPANLMYVGVLAVGIVGALIARLRPPGMARAMFAAAGVQALVGMIALIGGLGQPGSGPLEIVLLNGFFVALFAGSGWLFRHAT